MRDMRALIIIIFSILIINIVIIKAAFIGNSAISMSNTAISNKAVEVYERMINSQLIDNQAIEIDNQAIDNQEIDNHNQDPVSNSAFSNSAIMENANSAVSNLDITDNIEWVDPQEQTLSLSEHFTRGNFIIEATDFSASDSTVLITVYDNKYGTVDEGIVSKVIARTNDAWNISDKDNTQKLNITIKDLKIERGNISASEGLNVVVDERVKIQTKLEGQPKPILSILPIEKQMNNRTIVERTFSQGSEISINFSIKNDGKALLRNMHLVITRDKDNTLPFLFSDEQVDRELPDLAANETEVINVRFKAPNVDKDTQFNISGTVAGNDFFGKEFSITDRTFIIVKYFYEKLIDVQKYVPEKVYMGDYAYIVLNVQNNGFSNITNIRLIEQVPEGFEKLDDFNFNNYTFDLGPSEKKTITYGLIPLKPGIYEFPEKSSVIEWDGGLEFNNKSSKLIVNGPFVELKKLGTVEGDSIKITILAKNSGDMTAIARLRDLVPNGESVVKSLVIRPNSMAIVTYSIKMSDVSNVISDGQVYLPAAQAEVLDQFLYSNDKYAQQAISNNLTIPIESTTSQ